MTARNARRAEPGLIAEKAKRISWEAPGARSTDRSSGPWASIPSAWRERRIVPRAVVLLVSRTPPWNVSEGGKKKHGLADLEIFISSAESRILRLNDGHDPKGGQVVG
jgi:hypothetical protein